MAEEQHPERDNPPSVPLTDLKETLTEFAQTFARQVVAELRSSPTSQPLRLPGGPSENPEEADPPTRGDTGGEFGYKQTSIDQARQKHSRVASAVP